MPWSKENRWESKSEHGRDWEDSIERCTILFLVICDWVGIASSLLDVCCSFCFKLDCLATFDLNLCDNLCIILSRNGVEKVPNRISLNLVIYDNVLEGFSKRLRVPTFAQLIELGCVERNRYILDRTQVDLTTSLDRRPVNSKFLELLGFLDLSDMNVGL